MKLILTLIAALILVTCALAQDGADESIATALTGLTPQQQLYFTWGWMIWGVIGKSISAARNGGGLRRMILTVWFGENLPKPVAKDYGDELNTKKDSP